MTSKKGWKSKLQHTHLKKKQPSDYILPYEKKLRSNRFADVLKLDVLKHFAKFTEKLEFLFHKVRGDDQ